jgi:integrase
MAGKHGNRWRVKVRQKDGTRKYVSFDTREKAEEFEGQIPRGVDALVDMAGRFDRFRALQEEVRAGVTLADYAEQVVARRNLRQGTRDTYAKSIKYLRAAPIGAIRVGKVTDRDVIQFFDGLTASRRNVHQLLALTFNQAIRQGMISQSPLYRAGLPRPQTDKEQRVQRPMTVQEVESLTRGRSKRDALIIRLGAYAGLRASEIGGLRLQDVDAEGCRLTVAQAATRTTTGRSLGLPKRRASVRTISLDCDLARELADYAARHPQRDGLVFRTRQGGLIDASAIDKMFSKARREAGLGEFTFHDLRHFCASTLARAGMPMPVLQRHMGWSSIAMTDTYVHLSPTADGGAGAIFDRIRREAVRTKRSACSLPPRLRSRPGGASGCLA